MKRRLASVMAAGTVVSAYAFGVRPELLRWRATDEEVERPYPGPDLYRDSRDVASTRTAMLDSPAAGRRTPAVDLYWLPLGAGGHSVRFNGRVFEALAALAERRPACDLYHSALHVRVAEGTFVIEMAPVRDRRGSERGTVAEGAVGTSWAGRYRLFRYEIRRWRGGHIPDVGEAVESPRRLTDDEGIARRLLGLVPRVPTLVWGRDQLDTGDMWNSNSVISWLVARSGIDTASIYPPAGGRAPGWQAGLALARRQDPEGGPRRSSVAPAVEWLGRERDASTAIR